MSQKKTESNNSGGFWVVMAVLGWGVWLALVEWWEANWVVALERLRVAGIAVFGLGVTVLAVRWRWKRRRSVSVGVRTVGDGWPPGARSVVAVVPSVEGPRGRLPGSGPPGRVKVNPVLEFWLMVLGQAARLPGGSSERVVRAMWVLKDGKPVCGVSVDRELGRSVSRSVASAWPGARVEPWPFDETGPPVGEGGGAVVRRYLVPRDPARPLGTPSGTVDHPLARVSDVLADHPEVDVQLRIDLVPLSPAERGRVCADRLKSLDEYDPDRAVWETEEKRDRVAGVRVLLRVAREGPGHASECEQVAARVCGVLDSFWATDHNGLTARKIKDQTFDRIWDRGALERDVPAWHWDSLQVLLAPPPAKIAGITAERRLPDPPRLETFDPYAPESAIPIGLLSDRSGERLVGVRWGGDTDPFVSWTIGATGSGKTVHATAQAIALADTGRGFLFVDPHRAATRDIKQFVSRHADRILEIDLQATDRRGEPISAGWNPLDLTVVPPQMRKGRIENLKGMLPGALFPNYFTADGKAPQTATIIRKAIECLLQLNHRLPPQIQANIFCMEHLLLDESWRDLAIAQLRPRDQQWWHRTFPMIVGQKGAASPALKPALNGLEQWKAQDRVQALLGASQSTLRWRDIIDQGKILFVVLNNDGSETDNLLARLVVGEMVTAFKERGLAHQQGKPIRPFHLFLDEFQSYATVFEAQAGVIVQELRKFGAKVHFINQSPSAVPRKMREVILSNLTHMFSGRLGNPADAETIAKAMGGQQRHQDPGHPRVESRDLLKMAKWHFICQVTQNGELSSAFQLRGIDANKTWAHLRSDQNITPQITENTGLQPVEQRLDHYDTLPGRIAEWLRNQ